MKMNFEVIKWAWKYLSIAVAVTAVVAGHTVFAAAEADMLIAYDSSYSSSVGGDANAEVNTANAVAASNLINDNSGTGARLRICGYHKTTGQAGRTSLGGYVNWMLNYGDGELDDVTAAADAAGADLVSFICEAAAGETSAAVAFQPGRYAAYGIAYFWNNIVAHESGGHNYGCDHRAGRENPKTIMLHNYCSGGSQPYYSNPNVWLNGVNLIGDGGCLGSALQGGDAAYVISAAAQGVADTKQRVVYGSSLSDVVYRWQFTNSPAAAPAGTTIADEVSGALATVRGTNATFTGNALRLPGGTTGNTAADSIAAYIDLPNGMFSAMPDFTIEIWATPLSALNGMRLIEIGRTVQAGDGAAGEWSGLPGTPAPGSTSPSDIVGLNVVYGNLSSKRLFAGINGTVQSAITSLGTTAGTMYHYALTFTDTASGGTVAWYRNGVLVKSINVDFHSSDIEDVNNWLGRSLSSAAEMANMDYHDVRIQDVALKGGQVAANYRIGPFDQIVTLRTSDIWSLHTSSFVNGAWEFGQSTPDTNHDYEVGTLIIRTPFDSISSAFPGRSLSISGGQLHINATAAKTTTIDDLRLNGATVASFGNGTSMQTLAGQINAQSGSENRMRGAWGEMTISADITGEGTMLYTEKAVTLTGNNAGFLGHTLVGDGLFGTLRINGEDKLGPNPSTFKGDWLELNRGILETTQTMTIDDANRGIRIGASGGFLNPVAGTTLTIASPLSSPAAGNTLRTTPLNSNPIQGTLYVSGDGTVELTNPNNSHNGAIQVTSGELKLSGNGRINNGSHWMPVLVNGTFTDDSTYDQILSGGISGNGSIIKNGSTTLTLAGAGNFSGSMIVNGGTLMLNNISSSSSGTTTVNGGTLGGTGTIGGSLDMLSGAVLSPGASIGTMTVNADATLHPGSTTYMEINASAATSDRLDVSGTATLGGTLQVVNLAGTLVYGDVFTLFDAGSITGDFSSYVLPALDAGLLWDTGNIQDGVLFVNTTTPSAPPTPTGMNAVAINESQIQLDWTPSVSADSYNVKRASSIGGPYILIASGITDSSFIDSGLAAGTTYYYVVSAINSIGESAENSPVAGSTAVAPFAVGEWNFDQNLAYAGTALSAHPATDLTGNGNTMYGYDPTYGPAYSGLGATPSGSGLSINANGAQDAYLDDDVSSPSFNLNTWSPESWTIEASVVMDALGTWETFIGKDGTSHGVPESDFYLQKTDDVGDVRISLATVSGQRVIINTGFFPTVGQWFHLAVASDGSTLSIYVNNGSGWSLKGSAALTGGSAANNALANGNGANWTFMRGWYDGGFGDHVDGRIDNIRFTQGALSPDAFLYDPAPVTPLDTPSALVADAVSADEIGLSWSASTGAIGYYVKRSTSQGGPYTVVGQSVGTTFSNAGLTAGTAYYYVVAAITAAGVSGDSEEASAIPSAEIAPSEYHIADPVIEGGTNFVMTVSNSVVGHDYGILATDTLLPPAWSNIMVEAGTGSDLLFGIPIDPVSTNRYFMLDVQRQ